MKKINSLAASLFIAAFVLGAVGFAVGVNAQTTTTPPALTCSPGAPSVAAGNSVVLTATGGTGSYVWSGEGLTVTNPTGSTFRVTYNAAGTYRVTVTSGSQTATCNVIVTAVEAADPGGVGGVVAPPSPGLPNTGELPA